MDETEGCLFSLFAIPFALLGAVALWLHAESHLLHARSNANDTRLAVERVASMASVVQSYQKTAGRLPTSREINCNWKPCPIGLLWVWKVTPEPNNQFALTYTSLGVPFGPSVASPNVTWYSQSAGTDHDNLVQSWQWRIWFFPYAMADLTIIVLPWIAYALILRHRRRNPSPQLTIPRG